MKIEVLKSKIHRVKVTGADINYVGSISIDELLMEASNIVVGEKVQVLNLTNGERLETYVCLLYTSPSPRDGDESRMPSSA